MDEDEDDDEEDVEEEEENVSMFTFEVVTWLATVPLLPLVRVEAGLVGVVADNMLLCRLFEIFIDVILTVFVLLLLLLLFRYLGFF